MEKIDDYVKRSEVLALEKEVYVKEVDYRIRCIDASEVESLNGYVLTAETEAEIRKAVRVIIREAKRLTDAMIHYLSELAERKGANSDLIDRQAAIGAVGDVHPLDYNAQAILERIKALPTAEKVGKWIKYKDGYYRCSECGSRGSAIKAHYCHHCGSRNYGMKGEEDENQNYGDRS